MLSEASEGSESSGSASPVKSTTPWIRLPSPLSVKGICVFTAWKGSESDSSTSENNGHPGVTELLNLFVRHQVISIQLKIDFLQVGYFHFHFLVSHFHRSCRLLRFRCLRYFYRFYFEHCISDVGVGIPQLLYFNFCGSVASAVCFFV